MSETQGVGIGQSTYLKSMQEDTRLQVCHVTNECTEGAVTHHEQHYIIEVLKKRTGGGTFPVHSRDILRRGFSLAGAGNQHPGWGIPLTHLSPLGGLEQQPAPPSR